MDQTKFNIYQSVLEVVTNLHAAAGTRAVKGDQFTVSLMALRTNGEFAPIDIYVDRAALGTTSLKYKTVDKTQVLGATASIDPDGERFDIEFIIERHPAERSTIERPVVRVSPQMLRLLGERQAARMEAALEQIIDETDETTL